MKRKKITKHDNNTLDGGANIDPKIPVEDGGDSFEPKSSEVKEEEDDPTPLLPSILSTN